jgi:hypothetical protein
MILEDDGEYDGEDGYSQGRNTAKTDTAKTDTAKTDTAKTDTAKTDTAKTDTAKTGLPHWEFVEPGQSKA